MEITFDILEMAQMICRSLGSFAESVFNFFNSKITILTPRMFNFFIEIYNTIFSNELPYLDNFSVSVPIWSLVIGGMIFLPLIINVIKWILQLIDAINPIG